MPNSQASQRQSLFARPDLRRAFELLGLLCIGVVLIVVSAFVPSTALALASLAVGCGCVTIVVILSNVFDARGRSAGPDDAALRHFLETEQAACLLVDTEGEVQFANKLARATLPSGAGGSLSQALRGVFANPSAVLFRLQNKALSAGIGQEDVVTRKGQVRLSVRPVDAGLYSWRIEKVPLAASNTSQSNTINLPMMTVGNTGAILFMNDACRKFIGARPKSIGNVVQDLPLASGGLHHIITDDGTTQVRVFEAAAAAGKKDVFFFPQSDDADIVRLSPNGMIDPLASLPVPIMKVGSDGVILGANPRAHSVLETDKLVGCPLADMVGGLGRSVTDWVAEAARGHGVGGAEVLKLKHADIDRFFDMTLCRLEDEPGAVLVLMNDATEFKNLELQFVQSQKMQAIGQLAGGVAHDFNNLLTAISGHCDLLLLRHDQADQDYSDLIQIHQNANRAASLVGQLLAFSRKQNLKPEVLDLRDTLSELTHLLNRLVGEKVTLSLSHDPALAPIRADKRQLEQVLMNLVVNSRDAMPEGGEIRIVTSLQSFSKTTRRDRAEIPVGTYAQITVSDRGMGIPKNKIGMIFEPFFTTKKTGEGTGLGLSTAYGIVKQTGGFIFVESVVGSGTEFTVLFPIHEQEEPVRRLPPLAKVVQKPTKSTGVVLLVEDEAPVRAFASRALKMQGFTVLEADCAEAALETLQDENLQVDIFVTDVIMPGMDGPTWVRQALQQRPDVSVVFVSGYAEDAFKEGDKTIQNAVFLPKPFSLTDLTSTVQAQIEIPIQ